MRKLFILPLFVSLFLVDFGAFAAPQRTSARGLGTQEQTADQEITTSKEQISRPARLMGVAKPTAETSPVAARAATRKNVVSAPKSTGGVAVRAASKQKVINAGTKVQSATANTVVDQECQDAYYGCMDSFCMLDNTSGGRCQCSNKNEELDAILEEILKLDEQSYAMATEGVERLKMGENADEIMARAKSAADAVVNGKKTEESNAKKARTLNLDLWNNDAMFADVDEDIFETATTSSSVLDKKGDALHNNASKMCLSQIPDQCKSAAAMLQAVYAQKIRSDCTAYENSLKQQKNASAQKLQTAEKALRDTALEQFQDANKYNQGQCLTRYTQCMQTTAGCGMDYSGCVTFSAEENIQNAADASKSKSSRTSKKSEKARTISGVVDIVLAGSTMNQLNAKKVYCDDDVLSHCVKYKDSIWNLFLRDAAPALKSAELNAEDNLRKNCISEVATCFKDRCQSNFNPDSDSKNYDLCLADPWLLHDACKVKLDPCLVATGGSGKSETDIKASRLWQGVVAMLAAIRVDKCTDEVKQCIEGICGEDYSMCVGLSTDTIVDLCAEQKLTACQDRYGYDGTSRDVREYISQVAQGYALTIDSKLAETCEKAAQKAMITVCGDSEKCDSLNLTDDTSGTRMFKYEVCTYTLDEKTQKITWGDNCKNSIDEITQTEQDLPWAGKLSGIVYWNEITYDDNGNFITADEYIKRLEKIGLLGADDTESKQIIRERIFGMEMGVIESSISNAMRAIESDPTVDACLHGKTIQGIGTKNRNRTRGDDAGSFDIGSDKQRAAQRFPNLTKQMRQIITARALNKARDNYMQKYDEEIQRMMQDKVKLAARIDHTAAVNAAADACKDWAERSGLPVSKTPANVWRWVAVGLIVTAGVIGAVFTAGVGTAAALGAAIALGIGAGGTAITAGAIAEANDNGIQGTEIRGAGQMIIDQWNYKATINTMFNEQTGVCTKETISQNCEKTGTNKCKKWADSVTTTQELELL